VAKLKLTTEQSDLRNYLLGDLQPEIQEVLEQRLLDDDETYQELLEAEDELVDEYVAGELTERERRSFETHFLKGVDRQTQVRFAKALQDYIGRHQIIPSPSPEKGGKTFREQLLKKPSASNYLQFFPVLRQRKKLLAVCLALLIVLGVCVTYRVFQSRNSPGQLKGTQVALLVPGSTRGGGSTQRLKLLPSTGSVQFELELSRTSYQDFKAELSGENGVVKSFSSLKPQARETREVISFAVPVQLLSSGDYQLKLSGVTDSGAEEFIDSYTFRVSTQ